MAQIDKNSELQGFQAGPGICAKDRAFSSRKTSEPQAPVDGLRGCSASSLLLWSTFMEGGTVGITAQPKCKSCFPTKHTGFKSLCTLKESEVELKDITSLSFEIKEHQTWLGQYPYTKDPTCHGKQECLRPELHPVHFCPSQRCRYSVTSAGPRELEQRGDWDEDE